MTERNKEQRRQTLNLVLLIGGLALVFLSGAKLFTEPNYSAHVMRQLVPPPLADQVNTKPSVITDFLIPFMLIICGFALASVPRLMKKDSASLKILLSSILSGVIVMKVINLIYLIGFYRLTHDWAATTEKSIPSGTTAYPLTQYVALFRQRALVGESVVIFAALALIIFSVVVLSDKKQAVGELSA